VGPNQPETATVPPPRLTRVGGRIPSLDGLRAFSIGIVLLSHLNGTRNFLSSDEVERWHLGPLGVRVFFVISGFLITTLLLEEVDRKGTISLRHFYLRRFFRIFPAFYALCAVLYLLDLGGVLSLRPNDLTAAVTYTMNYHRDRSWYLGHAWSLSVEEQFYLLWPALLVFAGVRRGLMAAAAVVLLAPILRTLIGFVPSQRAGLDETFQTVADSLATGCLLAGLGPWLARSERWRRFLDARWFWLTALVVLAFSRNPSTRIDWLLGQTIKNVGIAAIIARTIRHPEDAVGRVLNTRPVVWVGTLSYSLYLWQQLFLNRSDSSPVQSFPLNLALAFGAAVVSYRFIESPFLALRARLERRPRPAAAPAPLDPRGGPAPGPRRLIELGPAPDIRRNPSHEGSSGRGGRGFRSYVRSRCPGSCWCRPSSREPTGGCSTASPSPGARRRCRPSVSSRSPRSCPATGRCAWST
jgi:peptidoglycan/LPS O-acetylase OafA/YrhL